jgi:hypothetical protein
MTGMAMSTRRPRFRPPGQQVKPDYMLAEVNVVVDRMLRDPELLFAIRASEHPACLFVGNWLAAAGFEPKILPVAAREFAVTLSRAINAARVEMHYSSRAFDQVFPRQPMLPGIDWPILWRPRRVRSGSKRKPRQRKRRSDDRDPEPA